jgi:hypothetical protein
MPLRSPDAGACRHRLCTSGRHTSPRDGVLFNRAAEQPLESSPGVGAYPSETLREPMQIAPVAV